MTIEELNEQIRKRQLALLRQITTREHRIAKLTDERDALRRQLVQVSHDLATAWVLS